jgi:hypothetical protein
VLVLVLVYLVPQEEPEQAPGLVDSVVEREQEQVCLVLVQGQAPVQEQDEENMVPDQKNKAPVQVQEQEPANMI